MQLVRRMYGEPVLPPFIPDEAPLAVSAPSTRALTPISELIDPKSRKSVSAHREYSKEREKTNLAKAELEYDRAVRSVAAFRERLASAKVSDENARVIDAVQFSLLKAAVAMKIAAADLDLTLEKGNHVIDVTIGNIKRNYEGDYNRIFLLILAKLFVGEAPTPEKTLGERLTGKLRETKAALGTIGERVVSGIPHGPALVAAANAVRGLNPRSFAAEMVRAGANSLGMVMNQPVFTATKHDIDSEDEGSSFTAEVTAEEAASVSSKLVFDMRPPAVAPEVRERWLARRNFTGYLSPAKGHIDQIRSDITELIRSRNVIYNMLGRVYFTITTYPFSKLARAVSRQSVLMSIPDRAKDELRRVHSLYGKIIETINALASLVLAPIDPEFSILDNEARRELSRTADSVGEIRNSADKLVQLVHSAFKYGIPYTKQMATISILMASAKAEADAKAEKWRNAVEIFRGNVERLDNLSARLGFKHASTKEQSSPPAPCNATYEILDFQVGSVPPSSHRMVVGQFDPNTPWANYNTSLDEFERGRCGGTAWHSAKSYPGNWRFTHRDALVNPPIVLARDFVQDSRITPYTSAYVAGLIDSEFARRLVVGAHSRQHGDGAFADFGTAYRNDLVDEVNAVVLSSQIATMRKALQVYESVLAKSKIDFVAADVFSHSNQIPQAERAALTGAFRVVNEAIASAERMVQRFASVIEQAESCRTAVLTNAGFLAGLVLKQLAVAAGLTKHSQNHYIFYTQNTITSILAAAEVSVAASSAAIGLMSTLVKDTRSFLSNVLPLNPYSSPQYYSQVSAPLLAAMMIGSVEVAMAIVSADIEDMRATARGVAADSEQHRKLTKEINEQGRLLERADMYRNSGVFYETLYESSDHNFPAFAQRVNKLVSEDIAEATAQVSYLFLIGGSEWSSMSERVMAMRSAIEGAGAVRCAKLAAMNAKGADQSIPKNLEKMSERMATALTTLTLAYKFLAAYQLGAGGRWPVDSTPKHPHHTAAMRAFSSVSAIASEVVELKGRVFGSVSSTLGLRGDNWIIFSPATEIGFEVVARWLALKNEVTVMRAGSRFGPAQAVMATTTLAANRYRELTQPDTTAEIVALKSLFRSYDVVYSAVDGRAYLPLRSIGDLVTRSSETKLRIDEFKGSVDRTDAIHLSQLLSALDVPVGTNLDVIPMVVLSVAENFRPYVNILNTKSLSQLLHYSVMYYSGSADAIPGPQIPKQVLPPGSLYPSGNEAATPFSSPVSSAVMAGADGYPASAIAMTADNWIDKSSFHGLAFGMFVSLALTKLAWLFKHALLEMSNSYRTAPIPGNKLIAAFTGFDETRVQELIDGAQALHVMDGFTNSMVSSLVMAINSLASDILGPPSAAFDTAFDAYSQDREVEIAARKAADELLIAEEQVRRLTKIRDPSSAQLQSAVQEVARRQAASQSAATALAGANLQGKITALDKARDDLFHSLVVTSLPFRMMLLALVIAHVDSKDDNRMIVAAAKIFTPPALIIFYRSSSNFDVDFKAVVSRGQVTPAEGSLLVARDITQSGDRRVEITFSANLSFQLYKEYAEQTRHMSVYPYNFHLPSVVGSLKVSRAMNIYEGFALISSLLVVRFAALAIRASAMMIAVLNSMLLKLVKKSEESKAHERLAAFASKLRELHRQVDSVSADEFASTAKEVAKAIDEGIDVMISVVNEQAVVLDGISLARSLTRIVNAIGRNLSILVMHLDSTNLNVGFVSIPPIVMSEHNNLLNDYAERVVHLHASLHAKAEAIAQKAVSNKNYVYNMIATDLFAKMIDKCLPVIGDIPPFDLREFGNLDARMVSSLTQIANDTAAKIPHRTGPVKIPNPHRTYEVPTHVPTATERKMKVNLQKAIDHQISLIDTQTDKMDSSAVSNENQLREYAKLVERRNDLIALRDRVEETEMQDQLIGLTKRFSSIFQGNPQKNQRNQNQPNQPNQQNQNQPNQNQPNQNQQNQNSRRRQNQAPAQGKKKKRSKRRNAG